MIGENMIELKVSSLTPDPDDPRKDTKTVTAIVKIASADGVIKRYAGAKLDSIGNAKSADVVIAVVGITSQLEGEELQVSLPGFKGGDRTSLDLPKEEEQLLAALKNTGKPLVVVLMNGSALSVNWADANAHAILEAWYPGEEGGLAIAETLLGNNNPAGRLPITFYKGIDQLPQFEDYSMRSRTYRYFQDGPCIRSDSD